MDHFEYLSEKYNFNKHINEGWTIGHFYKDLSSLFMMKASFGHFNTREDVKEWCMGEQQYWKKEIPELVDCFWFTINSVLLRGK